MFITRRRSLGLVALCATGILGQAHADTPDWRTATADDLAMKAEPKAPNAPAIILYMDVRRDDSTGREDRYQQVKILTEDGRSYGDIEIAYDRKREDVKYIEARTVRKDGTVVPYTGVISEKPLASGTDRKLMAKTLALTDVEVGSIIEYRYTRYARSGLRDTRWLLSNKLFTREAHYSFRGRMPLRYSAPRGLPPGTAPIVAAKSGVLTLQTHDVPAFVGEEYAPPEEEVQHRVDFIYAWDWDSPAKDPEKFWKRYAQEQHEDTQSYLLSSHTLKPVVAELASPDDPPEVRLRKLYAACAALRNKSYEPPRSDEEVEREDEAEPISARDVWRRKYGWAGQINLLFLAMAREAGFETAEVWVADRSESFFDPKQMDPGPLAVRLIAVTVADKVLYLSPGTKFVPFGALPWAVTGQRGLRIDKKGHSWVEIPGLTPEQSRVRREAHLTLSSDNELKGKVIATYTGHEAQWRRNRENNEDATHRRKFLEGDLLDALSDSAVVSVTRQPDWDGNGDFVVEYDLSISQRVLPAGARRVMPLALFAADTNKAFRSAERKYPMYFWYPYTHEEDVQIDLPKGWKLGDLPDGEASDMKRIRYSIQALKLAGDTEAVRVKRSFKMDLMLVPAKAYPTIRTFYQTMRAGDEQQIVVTAAP